MVAVRADIPLAQWHKSIESHKRKTAPKSSGIKPLFPGEIWREPIENAWTWGYPPGSTFVASYWSSPLCDDDPSDDDWGFIFYMSYNQDPDSLRWTSNSGQVYLAFQVAYGGNLNGYAFNWGEVRLCIGTNGVSAAGGPDNVKANVFVHQ
ncbi:MAG: hypothetical protein C4294_19580 [Nitrospiraceae bacterium]